MRLNQKKKLYIGLFSVALLLIVKLFFMQIIDDSYKHQALKNSMLYEDIYPARGIIYDRNGNIIVGNKVVYDLLVIPGEISEFDTLAFCNLIGISQESLIEKLNVYKSYRGNRKWKTDILLKKISQDSYLKFAEVSYMFPGFYGQARYVRDYPFNICGNLLGYISEVDDKFLKTHSDEYKRGDYAGRTGIEAAYEKELKGAKGYKI
jgi:penicillin-binding protein 2